MNVRTRTKIIVAALAAIALGLGTAAAVMLVWGSSPSPEQAEQILNQTEGTGPKVLITEFADFNCRFCAEFALAYYPRLREDFLSHPNVRFQFRHYPFLDETSWKAAHGYECARDQGLHEVFHDIAFRQHLQPEGPDFSPEGVTQIARIAGADIRRFDNCMWQNTHMAKVETDHSTGRKLRIAGTPTLFINGNPLEYDTYRDLRNAIEEVLGRNQT